MLSTFGFGFSFFFHSFLPTTTIHTSEPVTLTSLDTPAGKGRMEEGVFGEIQYHVGEESSQALLFLLLRACSVSKAAALTGTFELATGEK